MSFKKFEKRIILPQQQAQPKPPQPELAPYQIMRRFENEILNYSMQLSNMHVAYAKHFDSKLRFPDGDENESKMWQDGQLVIRNTIEILSYRLQTATEDLTSYVLEFNKKNGKAETDTSNQEQDRQATAENIDDKKTEQID